MACRRFTFKLKRNINFYLKFLIILFICLTLFKKLIFEKSHKRQIVVQSGLLDYNEDDLRKNWPFQMDKHYDVHDLRKYISKKKIIAQFDLPGELGQPVVLSPVLQDLAFLSFDEYQINIVASDKVAPNRSLPDLRDQECEDKIYPKLLPSVSVIMVVHNEAWSILQRAVLSVINRSPNELLEELILVDDFSDKEHLKEPLEEWIAKVSPKIKIIRTEKREGLIRTRVIGAEASKGQVLIFLDGNTESNDGWLEPLLSRIASDRSVIAIPHVDNINFTNMAYEPFDEDMMYGLGWNMYYKTFPLPEREMIRNKGDWTAPYRTPALIGCSIAIDLEFFFEIGTFDMGMTIWGGENTELSLRVWQCGGALEIVPCSRVGHYFRTLPYSFKGDQYEIKIRNNIRIAKVWMDEYKGYFDIVTPPKLRNMDVGDLSERIGLRNKLQCKGFHWYLENIFPESVMLAGFKHIGQINLLQTKYCIDRMNRRNNRQIGIHTCHGNGFSQGFAYQKNQQIVFHHSSCLSVAKEENITLIESNLTDLKLNDNLLNDPNILTPDMNTTNHVVFLECNATNGEKWNYDENNNQIQHQNTTLCLTTHQWKLFLEPCNLSDNNQKWIISTYEEYQRKLVQSQNILFDPSNP